MPVMVPPRALVAAALLCFPLLTMAAEVAVPPLQSRVTNLTGTLSVERSAGLEKYSLFLRRNRASRSPS